MLTFGEIDRQADAIAHALARSRAAARRPGGVLDRHPLDAVPLFAALARLGAVYCPLPGTSGSTSRCGIFEVADPALLVMDAEHAAGRQVRKPGMAVATLEELRPEADRQPAGAFPDAAHEADTARAVLHLGQHRQTQGRDPVPPRQLPAFSHPGSQEEPRGAMVCVYPALPHGRLDHLAAAVAGA